MGAGGIVDGQQLDDLHSNRRGPVGHHLEVGEIAHATTAFRPQREQRHHHAGCLPRGFLHTQGVAIDYVHLAVGHSHLGGRAVVAFLPGRQLSLLVVNDDIFIFQRHHHAVYVHREHPVELAYVLHGQIARRIPTADGRMASHQRQRLIRAQLRSRNAEHDGLAKQGQGHSLHSLRVSSVDIGVEMIVQGHIAP